MSQLGISTLCILSPTKTGIHLQLKLKSFRACFPLRKQMSRLKKKKKKSKCSRDDPETKTDKEVGTPLHKTVIK